MNKSGLKILLVDDEKLYRLTLSKMLETYGEIHEAENREEALTLLSNVKFDIAFIDLKLQGSFDGLDIVQTCSKQCIYSVVLSCYAEEEIIEKAYESGCQDFFEKGNEQRSIKEVMDKFFLIRDKYGFSSFIENDFLTQDTKTIEDLEFVFNNSTTNIPMFFSGPTGVGKTKLAKLVHNFSARNGKYIQINCSEINPNLIESELFGHKKGSFTNAFNDKEGLIKSADGGTLFLDEICSIPLDVQTKLLKIIEEKSYYPVGSDRLQTSDFRIISASQHSIVEKIQRGEFRSDLFYRISGINIRLKPLRERRGDIPLIINKSLKGNRRIVIKKDSMDLLQSYNWPGNVRELLKTVDLLLIKEKGIINSDDLPTYISKDTMSPFGEMTVSEMQYEYVIKHGLRKFLKDIEKEILKRTLKDNNDKVLATLSDLRISRTKYYSIAREEEGGKCVEAQL